MTKFDQPVLKMDGSAFEIDGAEAGGPCGVFVERDGGARDRDVRPGTGRGRARIIANSSR